METGTQVRLPTGRVAGVSPRTYGSATGWVVYLTAAEARKLRLPGHSNGRYSYSIDMGGNIERWVGEYGGWVKTVAPPELGVQ